MISIGDQVETVAPDRIFSAPVLSQIPVYNSVAQPVPPVGPFGSYRKRPFLNFVDKIIVHRIGLTPSGTVPVPRKSVWSTWACGTTILKHVSRSTTCRCISWFLAVGNPISLSARHQRFLNGLIPHTLLGSSHRGTPISGNSSPGPNTGETRAHAKPP